MLESWQAVVLGLVEGLTEYLPISSTGHLILAESLLGLRGEAQKPAIDAFTVVLQGGSILAVLGLYWRHVLAMLRGLLGRDPVGLRLLVNLLVAFVPAAVVGLTLDHWIEARLFRAGPVLAATVGGGVFMIALHRRLLRVPDPSAHSIEEIDTRQALLIGAMQCLALWPGMSRSMVVIAGGLLLGLRRQDAAEFSFLLGLPTLGGACVWKIFKERELVATLGTKPVLLGMVLATVSAALAVRWLVAFLNRRGLEPFGWYRIGLAAALFASLWLGWVELGGPS